jgi:transposase
MASEASATLEQLRQENQALRAQVAALEETVQRLQTQCQQLQEALDAAQRATARQAAPFRRPERSKVPEDQKKPPARPPGHPGAYRAVPTQIDERAEVPLTTCPGCGGPLAQVEPVEQFLEDLPPRRPHVTRIVTYKATCPNCGEVRSTHPLQMSEATGAAQVQLGPRAVALAVVLNKQFGLTARTSCRALDLLGGLRVTPGGLTQALQRVAAKFATVYDQLIDDLRRSAAVFADETSWYVGAPGYWLWSFSDATTTVYVVDPHRSHEIPLRILGVDFAGMLVSDCLSSYDPLPYRQHKCVGHHQKAIAAARDRLDTADPSYLKQWTLLFTMVSALWRHRVGMGEAEFVRQRTHLESWCDQLLSQERTQPGDVAVQERLRKQRESLFGCLYEPAAEPTNNRAERSLRPAVMARKVSCGNKTETGKRCFEVLASLTRTLFQRGHDVVSYLKTYLPRIAAPETIPRAATR